MILGLSSAAKFSQDIKILSANEYNLISKHIRKISRKFFLKNYFREKNIPKIIKFMKIDKKNSDDKINLILIKKVGNVNFNKKFTIEKIQKFFLSYFNTI